MADDKTPGRKAKEAQQSAQRFDKLERKGHGESVKPSPAHKATDKRHAANIYREVDKQTKNKK